MKNMFVVDDVFNYVERCQYQFVFLLSLKSISFDTDCFQGSKCSMFFVCFISKQEDDEPWKALYSYLSFEWILEISFHQFKYCYN